MPNGEIRTIIVSHFKAMEGWEIQHRFIEFAASGDKDYRRAYTFEVLAFAKVVVNERELPLSTDALIDNHLQTWQNIQMVFEEILLFNGIDPKTHADNPNYWAKAGEEMAISFMAVMTQLMSPAVEQWVKDKVT
jgi:hypothetical protein